MPDLLSKMEEAAAIIVANLAGTSQSYSVRTGLDDDSYEVPNIILTASDTGEQIPKNSGNKIVTLRATINSNPNDTTLVNFSADAKLLFDLFNSDDIGAQLSSAVDSFYVYDPPKENREGAEPKDNKLSKFIELELLACEADV